MHFPRAARTSSSPLRTQSPLARAPTIPVPQLPRARMAQAAGPARSLPLLRHRAVFLGGSGRTASLPDSTATIIRGGDAHLIPCIIVHATIIFL